MSEPDTSHQAAGGGADAAPGADALGEGHREHVRTDAEVHVDDELGTGDNVH